MVWKAVVQGTEEFSLVPRKGSQDYRSGNHHKDKEVCSYAF